MVQYDNNVLHLVFSIFGVVFALKLWSSMMFLMSPTYLEYLVGLRANIMLKPAENIRSEHAKFEFLN